MTGKKTKVIGKQKLRLSWKSQYSNDHSEVSIFCMAFELACLTSFTVFMCVMCKFNAKLFTGDYFISATVCNK